MAFIPIPNAVEVALHWTIAGQDVVMTFGIKRATAIDATFVQDVADAMATWATGRLITYTSSDMAFNHAYAADQSSSTGPTAISTINTGSAGAIASDAIPTNATLAISNRTPLRGRSYRGRNYVPGIPVNKQDTPTELQAAYVTNLLSQWANINTDLAGTGGVHAVLSRQFNNAPRTTGVATAVTGYRANTGIDGQRRRLLGRGT